MKIMTFISMLHIQIFQQNLPYVSLKKNEHQKRFSAFNYIFKNEIKIPMIKVEMINNVNGVLFIFR